MKTHHKLISYSSSAIVFILLHDAKAQAVYTDIDPDIILDEDFETAGVDLDNNGNYDFAFANFSYYTFTTDLEAYEWRQRIWGGAESPLNSLAGSYNSGRCYPFALSEGFLIQNDYDFHNWGYQRMAFRTYEAYWNGTSSEWIFQNEGGFWLPEIIDHYLAIRFIDSNACNHYGWIRCDVLDEGRTLKIKDYAYETKCDVGILAGDIIGDTSVRVENINSLDANVYSFENTIYVDLKDLHEKTEVYIYSISGDLVYTKTLLELNTTISLSLPKGIYMVNIVSNTGHYHKKFFIN